MASITFSGQLDQAMNEAAAEGNKILFIPQQTVGEVLPGAASELVVESDGLYSITLSYNTYSIYHYSDVTKRRTLLATDIVVSADTAVSTIPDLIGSTVPVTEDSVLTIQGYLTEAQDSATAAAESEAAVTNRVAAYEVETTEYLINTFDGSALEVGDVVRTLGYYTAGDGGGAEWIKTGDTGTASQSPVDLSLAQLNDSGGNSFDLSYSEIKPKQFGAYGDGETDDFEVLNLCADIFRSDAFFTSYNITVFDGEGLGYYSSGSLNFTKIRGRKYLIQNLSIVSACEGLVAIDCVGSRFGSMSNVKVTGLKDSMPSIGILFSRSSDASIYDFCNGWSISKVFTDGYFSIAGFFAYSQETSSYDNCEFWNANPNARAAVFTGNISEFTGVSSEYATVQATNSSYINCDYSNVICRYIPTDNIATITAITQDSPATVTVNAIPDDWSDGDSVCISGIKGMTELANQKVTISNIDRTNNTFDLSGVDSTSYSAFTSGTAIYANTVSPFYFCRGANHSFASLYVISYGIEPVELSIIDTDIKALKMGLLTEGSGFDATVKINNDTSYGIVGLDFLTYNTHSLVSIIDSDDTVSITGSRIEITNNAFYDCDVFGTPANMTVTSTDIITPDSFNLDVGNLSSFTGSVKYINDGEYHVYASSYENIEGSTVNTDPIEYEPTVSFLSGEIGSYTTYHFDYYVVGKLVTFYAAIALTDVGTGTGALSITSPQTPSRLSVLSAREFATGDLLTAYITLGSSIRVIKNDGSAFENGDTVYINGTFPIS